MLFAFSRASSSLRCHCLVTMSIFVPINRPNKSGCESDVKPMQKIYVQRKVFNCSYYFETETDIFKVKRHKQQTYRLPKHFNLHAFTLIHFTLCN